MKNIFKSFDRYGSRAVSANQNGWVQKLLGQKTPLDVQGFDYSTDKYDEWHLQVRWFLRARRWHLPLPSALT